MKPSKIPTLYDERAFYTQPTPTPPTPPTLAECREAIIELMGCLEDPIESKSTRESALDMAADLIARIEAANDRR